MARDLGLGLAPPPDCSGVRAALRERRPPGLYLRLSRCTYTPPTLQVVYVADMGLVKKATLTAYNMTLNAAVRSVLQAIKNEEVRSSNPYYTG